MKIKQVYHLNSIGHEINNSVRFNYPKSDREIYCKKYHKITEPTAKMCDNCPYFAGTMMGHGIECKWDDVIEEGDEKLIPHNRVHDEFLRVSQLIDKGILKKG